MLNVLLFGMREVQLCEIEEKMAAFSEQRGMNLTSIQVKGEEGSALHMRLGAGANPCVPVIPQGQADILCGFDPGTGLKYLTYLKWRGVFVLLQREEQAAEEKGEVFVSANGYDPAACLAFLKRRVHHVMICSLKDKSGD